MKASRYVLIAAAIVAVLAMIAWFLRDNLIERISNPLLSEYGISVTDVSLDALATDNASIGYLELVHDKGTTIAIEQLALPLGTKPGETKTYTARKVSIITSTRKDGEPFELAQLINQLISLPDKLDDSAVAVAEFSLPPYPTIYDVRWNLTDGEQRLRATVDSIVMSAAIARIDATNHTVVFSVPGRNSATQGRFVTANLQQDDPGILLNGLSSIDLSAWAPAASLAGIVPPRIEISAGTATLQYNVEIPNDANQSPTLVATLLPTSPLQLTYADESGGTASILVESAGPLEVEATFPEPDWSLRQALATLLITYGEWRDIPLILGDLSCQVGPVCAMRTRVAMDAANLPIGMIDRVELVSTEKVLFRDSGVRIDIQTGATLKMTALANARTKVDRIEGQLLSDASLEFVDNGWRLAADSVDANIGGMSLSDSRSIAMPLFLEDVQVSKLDSHLSMRSGLYIPSSHLSLHERRIALPGFKGDVAIRENRVSADLTTIGLEQNGAIEARLDLDTGAGRLNASNAAISFKAKSLADRISPWPVDRDLVAGTVGFDFDANWSQESANLELAARSSVAVADLAGYYGDTAFADLSSQVTLLYRSATGFEAQPSTITIALIDMGLPVENLAADYAVDPKNMSVDVRNLQMNAFGGNIEVDPFSFRTETDSNTLTLHADSIELTELLSLGEFEAIEVSGSIGATLPITIQGDTITIERGTMTGGPEGGVIRYLPDSASDDDASAFGLATRALSNFEFDTLTSAVDLTREGDLKLDLRLTGRNPDLDGERPVVLNLGVESNIPQMLKSLRAARAVEDILERRLGN